MDFDASPFVKKQVIALSSVTSEATNGISIECGLFNRGGKAFYFCIWLDQLVRCKGDTNKQEYFWYGVFAPSKGALKELVAMLPVQFKPSHVRGGNGKHYFTPSDLKSVPKPSPGRGKFKQFRNEFPKKLLRKVIEERYGHGSFLGCFVKRGSIDARSNAKLGKAVRLFWRALTAAATESSKQGTASTKKQYKVKVSKQYEVFPVHTSLQKSFESWVHREWPNKFMVRHNDNLADTILQSLSRTRPILVEVKTGLGAKVEFAAREAIGQLLQYRFDLKGAADMAVVLADEPSDYTAKLLRSLKIGFFWKAGRGFKGEFSS